MQVNDPSSEPYWKNRALSSWDQIDRPEPGFGDDSEMSFAGSNGHAPVHKKV